MRRTTKTFLLLAAAALPLVSATGPVQADPARGAPPFVPGELIVLLDTDASNAGAEEIARRYRQGLGLPFGLDAVHPTKVGPALLQRGQGRAREEIAADPEGPRARLERYLLLSFPTVANLDAIELELANNPHVLHVERNYLFHYAVSPSDPFFPAPVGGGPPDYQWGLFALNLPQAWDSAKGHSYVGLIDTGLQVTHPDLRPFGDSGSYLGGNFRPHLSWDFDYQNSCYTQQDTCVDEREGSFYAGHGTHVSGIVAATTDNATGVAGTCWHCSLLMARGTELQSSVASSADVANGLTWLVDHGVQAISMSFGADLSCDPLSNNLGFVCDALDLAERRDVFMTAAPGNDKRDIEFPASDPRVLSIGGIESGGAFWDREDEGGCPCAQNPSLFSDCSQIPTKECGSNYTVTPGSARQDLVAPAKQVLSTFYENGIWNTPLGCSDVEINGINHAGVGYDVCTGTSMSSPFVAGIAGILRSVNPLLSKAQITAALTNNASRANNWDARLGYGVPNAAASVQAILGRSNGAVLANRLTPLFVLYSSTAEDHLYTTFPQVGSAFYWSPDGYSPYGAAGNLWPDVPGYGYFPGAGCVVSPCLAEPGASVFVFTDEKAPFAGAPPLVPLYRMSYKGATAANANNRDTTYTTEKGGIEAFAGVGYELDGIEGYIFKRCTPEPSCIPQGAVRLFRRYNAQRDDFAIFPESELSVMESQGYISTGGNLNEVIGYVYPNVDSDGDAVIDGFEGLIGTMATRGDSDCDGVWDGEEILGYPNTDPLIENSGPGCVPTACFTAVRDGLTLSFDASCSTDPLGSLTYAWNFGDTGTGTGKTTSHTYQASGSNTVVLTVTNLRNRQATTSKIVNPDAKPVACFTWSCNLRTCTFDASCSSDNQPIPEYSWNFGDATSGTGKVVTHVYAAGGLKPVTLTVKDSASPSQQASQTQQVLVNRPPVANPDTVIVTQNVAIDIAVLANDSDPDGDPISVSSWTQPAHGTVAKNANGTMRYTPSTGYLGPDSFSYQITDGKELSSSTTVSLTVQVPNKAPDARDDGWSTYQNGPTNIPYSHLLANDYDPNGDPLTVTAINTAGLNGTLDCSSGTYCRYTPGTNFRGTTSFSYSASDGRGGTDPAVVRIKVGVTNNPPAPQDDILETSYNTPLMFTQATLLLNDADPDGDVLSVSWIYRSVVARGTVSCSAAYYTCTYTPPAGFTGVDVLFYRASDGITFTDALIRILVRPPSPAVLDARDDQVFTTTTTTYISYGFMTSNDYNPAGGALTVVSVDTAGLVGTLDCTTSSTGCDYTRGTSSPTQFRYTVRNAQGSLDTTTVTIKPGNWSFNRAPVINNDQLSTRTNTPLTFSLFDVLRNDYDPDNDQLTASFYFSSQFGRVSCSTPAYVCTYTPNANFTGTDTLTYVAHDGTNSANGSVTMTVLPVVVRDAQILSQSVPMSMFAGQSYPVSIKLKNVGTLTWSPVGPQCNAFRLGAVNPYDNTTWGSSRAELPAALAPGGEVTINFTVTAPSTPGTYNFQRRMVQECVTWFGDLSPNLAVTVSP